MKRTSSFTSSISIIKEAPNIARWNPNLAIQWMNEVTYDIDSFIYIKQWNNSAKKINNTIKEKQNSKCYSKEDYWGGNTPSYLTLLDNELSLQDYISISQYKNEI